MSDDHVIEAPSGTITVPAAALAAVVTRAAESVDGAKVRRRGVEVRVEDGTVHARIDLSVRFGMPLPDLGRDVQRSVTDALATMCGFSVDAVDLHVEELE